MGEALRHEELAPVFRGKLDRGMLSEGRRTVADVDDHIENRAADRPDELRLAVRRCLKMQAADHSHPDRPGLVVLDEFDFDADLAEPLPAIDLGQRAALVLVLAGGECDQPGRRQLLHLDARPGSVQGRYPSHTATQPSR